MYGNYWNRRKLSDVVCHTAWYWFACGLFVLQAAINTLLTNDYIINTYAYDLRVVNSAGMPDEKHMAHWKL